ncbi:cell division suppressor protein YneA [Gallicola sp. Sow4_E12]|uniref:cell division suppressor protein YneA n=1 Tax=Gallicola sp. Sow4_E12 TaxID=3438785 RepID=UPI003F910D9E
MRLRVVNKTRFSIFIIVLLSILFLTMGSLFFQIKSYGLENNEDQKLYTVAYGDTLWKIAEEYKFENIDTRDYIANIKRLNNMKKAAVMPGEQLILPSEN